MTERAPSPRPYAWLLVLLALAGAGVSAYLLYHHFSLRLGHPIDSAVCGDGGLVDCNAVAASRYAEIAGVPVAALGLAYYGALLGVALGALLLRDGAWRPYLAAALGLGLVGLAVDVYLGVAMQRLGVVCPLCVTTYLVNVAFVAVAFWARRRLGSGGAVGDLLPRLGRARGDGYHLQVVRLLLLLGVAVQASVVLGASAWGAALLAAQNTDRLAGLLRFLEQQPPHSLPDAERPARGAADAAVTIVEFSDFLCPHCRRQASYERMVAADLHDELRLIFRHFPLDAACNPHLRDTVHPGACLLAEASVCAHEQGRFWPFHDAVFADERPRWTRAGVRTLAAELGLDLDRLDACLESDLPGRVVAADIQLARELGLRGTPTLLVDGKMLQGVLEPSLLRGLVEARGQ